MQLEKQNDTKVSFNTINRTNVSTNLCFLRQNAVNQDVGIIFYAILYMLWVSHVFLCRMKSCGFFETFKETLFYSVQLCGNKFSII